MKKTLVALVAAIVLADAGWHLVSSSLEAVDRSMYKRLLADARSVVTVLEAVKRSTGSYPATTSVDELARMVTPTYIKKLDADSMRYFSDGRSYVFFVGFPRGAYPPLRKWGGPIEVRDGIVVSAPEWLNVAPSAELTARSGNVQPNPRLDAAHSGVTALAQGRKRRAAGRARQAYR